MENNKENICAQGNIMLLGRGHLNVGGCARYFLEADKKYQVARNIVLVTGQASEVKEGLVTTVRADDGATYSIEHAASEKAVREKLDEKLENSRVLLIAKDNIKAVVEHDGYIKAVAAAKGGLSEYVKIFDELCVDGFVLSVDNDKSLAEKARAQVHNGKLRVYDGVVHSRVSDIDTKNPEAYTVSAPESFCIVLPPWLKRKDLLLFDPLMFRETETMKLYRLNIFMKDTLNAVQTAVSGEDYRNLGFDIGDEMTYVDAEQACSQKKAHDMAMKIVRYRVSQLPGLGYTNEEILETVPFWVDRIEEFVDALFVKRDKVTRGWKIHRASDREKLKRHLPILRCFEDDPLYAPLYKWLHDVKAKDELWTQSQ